MRWSVRLLLCTLLGGLCVCRLFACLHRFFFFLQQQQQQQQRPIVFLAAS